MKKLLAVLLTLAMVSTLVCGLTVSAEAVAVTVASDDNSWTNATYDAETGILTNVDGGYAFKATISKGNATLAAASADLITAESVTIPSSFTVDGTTYNVTNVAQYILSGGSGTANANVKKVVLSEGVTTLNDNAFRKASALAEINIPASLTKIGGYAFYESGIAGSVTIPATVTSLGKGSFGSTPNLESITIAEGSPITAIPNEFLRYSGVVSVSFPKTITSIGGNAFQAASKFSTINGSSTVFDLSFVTSSIGAYSFQQAGALKGEFIVNAATVGKEAFKQTGGVTKFTWGENVQKIESGLHFRYDYAIVSMVFLGMTAPAIDSNSFGNTSEFTIYYPQGATGYDAAGYLAKTCVPFGGYISAMTDDGADTTVTYSAFDVYEGESVVAVVALYAGDVMVGAKTVSMDETTATFTGVTGATKAKIYMWASLANAKPLYDSYEFVPVVEEPAA